MWLGITVGTDDEMQPRVQLGSVPFAVQALTVSDGSVTTAKIADGAVTQAKLGADVSLVPPDGSITTAKLADGAVTTGKIANGAVTSTKQAIATFHGADNTFARLQGHIPVMTISEFRFDNVPPGELEVIVTLTGWVAPGASNRGSVWIEIGGTRLDEIPTHLLTAHYTQLTLHGRLPNFSGGTLIVQVKAGSEIPEVDIGFGVSNGDGRFGRRITVVAGL